MGNFYFQKLDDCWEVDWSMHLDSELGMSSPIYLPIWLIDSILEDLESIFGDDARTLTARDVIPDVCYSLINPDDFLDKRSAENFPKNTPMTSIIEDYEEFLDSFQLGLNVQQDW